MTPTDHDDTFDPFSPETGLIDDFDFTVDSAWFTTDAAYNNGETLLLKLNGPTDNPDQPETTLQYSCGSGWEAEDNGKRAVREDGKRRRFNQSSGIWKLVDAAMNAGAGDALRSRGTPMEASMWVGLRFHMKRVEQGEGDFKTTRPLPVSFLGTVGEGSAAAAPAAASSTPAPTAAANGAGLSKVLEIKLKKLAKEAATHEDFIVAAFELDGVDGNADAERAVVDEAWFLAAKG
jgi:hypothetical protein